MGTTGSGRTCTDCDKPVSRQNTSGLCKPCWGKRKSEEAAKRPQRHCDGCGTEIGRQNRSGLCVTCLCRRNSSDPAIRGKAAQTYRETAADPEFRKRRSRQMREYCATHPELIELRRKNGKKHYHKTVGSAKARKAVNAPEAIAKRGRSISRARLEKAGCPLEYRELYLKLQRNHGLRWQDALEAVREQIHQDEIAAHVRYAEDAAHFLSRFAPTFREGEGWHYGTVTMTPEQLVERAMSKGWQPERFAA